MADKETQKYLDEYKKKVAAEKAKDPKAFEKKYGKKPPVIETKIMITYEVAKNTALKINNKFNMVFDYGTACVFSIKGDTNKDNPNIAILKNDGKPVPFTQYLMTRNTNASPTNIPF